MRERFQQDETPSTQDIKDRWMHAGYAYTYAQKEAEFDRWLAARERENRAIGWDEARARFREPEANRGCVCISAEHRRDYPAAHWLNPYRGDNE